MSNFREVGEEERGARGGVDRRRHATSVDVETDPHRRGSGRARALDLRWRDSGVGGRAESAAVAWDLGVGGLAINCVGGASGVAL